MGIMQEDEIVWIGTRSAWGGERPFGLRRVDRRQHDFVVGKSGTGKTMLLRSLILLGIQAGRGITFIEFPFATPTAGPPLFTP